MLLKVVKTKSLWTNGSYSKKQTSVDLGHWELEIISYASMSSLTSWKIKRPYDWVNLWRPTWSITWCWLRGNGISFLANSEFNDGHRKLNTGVHWSIFFSPWAPTVLTELSCLLQWQQTEECWRSKDNTAARDIWCRPHKLKTPLENSWTYSISEEIKTRKCTRSRRTFQKLPWQRKRPPRQRPCKK